MKLSTVGLAWRPNPLLPLRRLKRTRLHPTEPRRSRSWERQRVNAIGIVSSRRAYIREVATAHRIAPEAIAAAILWDPLENPYRRSFLRLGLGRVRPLRVLGMSEAEKVELAGLVSAGDRSAIRRLQRLRDPDWAVLYIAAIMRRHADNYRDLAGVEIATRPAILCTLYQGGRSEARAKRLAARRAKGQNPLPIAADEMGPWAEQHLLFIKSLLAPTARDATRWARSTADSIDRREPILIGRRR